MGGIDPADQSLSLRNCGGGTLNWETAGQPEWLTVQPSAGASNGEVNQSTLSVDISGLPHGAYVASLEVSDSQAVNSPRDIVVMLYVWDTLAVPSQYSTIQAAIDAAVPGDEIVVSPGAYLERINLLGKAITLRSSDGPAATIIDGDAGGSVIACKSGEGSDTVIDGFTFTNGRAEYGGGMFNSLSSPTVVNCIFIENSTTGQYGSGGGMYNSAGRPALTNCVFSGNSAYRGGGIGNVEGGHVTLTNCILSGNSAYYGGGMYNINSSPTVTNCTFAGNSANEGGGMYYSFGSPTLTNCILWGNTAPSSPQIYAYITTATVTYSCIQDGWTGEGNIAADPLFLGDPNDGGDGWGDDPNTPGIDEGANDDYGDLSLLADSLCIDAADNSAIPADTLDLDNDEDTDEPLPVDLDCQLRFVDRTDIVDTGLPHPDYPDLPIVDMGAYEYQYMGDLDGDGDVDLGDLATLLAAYGTCTGEPHFDPAADIDGSGCVDLADIGTLLADYGLGT